MWRSLSIAFQGDKPLAAYGPLARVVEAGGFDAISVYADLGFQPAIGPLLEIARATERVQLGPAALNPYLLHPVEIASQTAMLDAASDGRAWVGLVRGAWLDSLGITDRRPLATMREAVDVIRRVLAGDSRGYQGDVFRLPSTPLLTVPVLRADVPLLIGGWGPKTLRLAGELADEVKVGGSTNPDLVPVVRRYVAEGARRAGRDPETIGICFGAVTVVDEDGERARERVRLEAARYLPVVAPLDPTVEVPAGVLRRMAELVGAGDDPAAGALVPDDILDRFGFSGTPDHVAQQAAELFDAGVTRVEFGTPHGVDELDGIHLLCERVLPVLRRD